MWYTPERVSLYPRLLQKDKQLNLQANKSSCEEKERKTSLCVYVFVKLEVLVYPQGHKGIEVWYTLEGVSLYPQADTKNDKQLNIF